jgi:ribosomal-protein-alanine N-acetyltransferase
MNIDQAQFQPQDPPSAAQDSWAAPASPARSRKAAARVYLRQPRASDEAAFIAAARRSATLHRPWTKAPDSGVLYRAYLERMAVPGNIALVAIHRDSEELAGVFNITHIVLGAFRCGYLGYYAFAGFEGRGLMREALDATLRYAFGPLRLHRLEANIQPGNDTSIALARACGFALEGYSPRYLKIGGKWRDHQRWAALAS